MVLRANAVLLVVFAALDGVLDEVGGSQSMRAVYRCRQCGKTYCWKKTLQRHMKLTCGGKEPQFPCPVCHYRFKYKSHRLRHMTKLHHVSHEEAQAVIDNMKDEDDVDGLDGEVEGLEVDVDIDEFVMGMLPPRETRPPGQAGHNRRSSAKDEA